jgi:hypothetical protein
MAQQLVICNIRDSPSSEGKDGEGKMKWVGGVGGVGGGGSRVLSTSQQRSVSSNSTHRRR